MEELLVQLLDVRDLPGFRALLRRRPELLGSEVSAFVSELSENFGHGATFARVLALLEDARTAPSRAWQRYEAALERLKPVSDQLKAIDAAISQAEAERAFGHVLELANEGFALACEAGYGGWACEYLQRTGLAFYNMSTDQRAVELEQALRAFQLALEVAVPGDQAASVLMHLGMTVGDRVNGDRAENLERAILTLRAGLEQLEGTSHHELRAMMQTNLAVALIRSEHGDRVTVLEEAAALCRCALEYRSPARDADDWAYAQINFGDALNGLAESGHAAQDDASRAYLRVIEEQPRISRPWLIGTAHHMLGRAQVALTYRSAEDLVDEFEEAGALEERDNTPVLLSARDHLLHARDLCRDGPDPLRYGIVLNDLGGVLETLGLSDAAIDTLHEALSVLRPMTAPQPCREAATRLGGILAGREDWHGAAIAYRDAIEAAELTFHSRLDTASREQEMRRSGSLHRWAAYALARSGDHRAAAHALESGRGRELRRRMGAAALDEETTASIPTPLLQEYRSAAEALLRAPMDSSASAEARRLQEAVAAIRELPRLASFGSEVSWTDLVAALEPEWPLVYVNPTPAGTLLLCLQLSDDAEEATAEAAFVDITSTEVFMRLMTGKREPDFDEDDETVELASYLVGISGVGTREQRDFKRDLDETLPWFGEHVSRRVRDLVVGRGARGVTLVPCGPIAVLPLHAANWVENGGSRCLSDELSVRYAPSASVCATARRRATERETVPPYLVALGDPTLDLPGARPEVLEISRLFPDASTCALGADADRVFLAEHGDQATHLHFACHARGGLFDGAETGIFLASGFLPATALTGFGGLTSRLVVISACQSALSEIAGLPEEFLSIATSALAAGSACVIASLWPVDDLATAILMTRLYEEVLLQDERPPEALRRAQLWLRDLSRDDEHAFLARHPSLLAEFQRRLSAGDAPGRRTPTGSERSALGPYAHPDYWAPFIAMGV